MATTFSLKQVRARAGFSSNTPLARAVLTRWSKLDARVAKPAVRSLAAKLSELERNPVWWRNHPRASQALAAALGLRVEELPLDALATAPLLHRFDDFDQTRPLDLTSEVPCQLSDEVWWRHEFLVGRGGGLQTWVTAPPGSGKSLAVELHRARGTPVLRLPRLHDALGHIAGDEPLVLDIEGPDRAADCDAMDALHDRRGLLVFASFAPPTGRKILEQVTEHFRRHNPEQLDPASLARIAAKGSWRHVEWKPWHDWRARFCRWVFERLGEHDRRHLDPVLEWFEANDPRERLFATPGDVLPLLEWAWRETSLKRLRRDQFVEHWLERQFSRAVTAHDPRKGWLVSRGAEALRALADRALVDLTTSFPASLPRSWWCRQMPIAIAPSAPVEHLIRQVEEIAHTGSLKRREVLVGEWRGAASLVSAEEAVHHLRTARFLRPKDDGSESLGPPWLVEWWAERRIGELVVSGRTPMWGRLAADPTRRRLVEEVLDRLEHQELLGLVNRVLDEARGHAPTDLGAVGAMEATFGAVGRRLLRRAAVTWPSNELHALFALQQSWISPRQSQGVPEPLTRPGAERDHDASWIAECWAWSFEVAPPSRRLEDAHAWLFPGWHVVALDEHPLWLAGVRAGSPSFDGLMELAGKFLRHSRDTGLPRDVPAPLCVEYLLSSPARGWTLSPELMDRLIERDIEETLVRRLEALPFDQRRTILTECWTALVCPDGQWSVPLLRREHPALFALLEATIDVGEVEAAARSGSISFRSLTDRASWPPAWWSAAARVLVPTNRDRLSELWSMEFDETAAEIAELLVGYEPTNHLWYAAMWRAAPARAVERVQAVYPDGPHVDRWLSTAPAAARSALLATMDHVGAPPLTEATRRCLARWILGGGVHAETAFRLLAREPPKSG